MKLIQKWLPTSLTVWSSFLFCWWRHLNETGLFPKLMYCLFCCPTGVFTAAFDCQIEWLIVKGIADYADGSQLASESWSSCASVMAASLVAHMLNEPRVFHSWPHYQGNHAIIKCCHILASDLLNLLLGSFHSTVTDKLHGTCSLCGVCHPKFSCPTLTTCSSCLSWDSSSIVNVIHFCKITRSIRSVHLIKKGPVRFEIICNI